MMNLITIALPPTKPGCPTPAIGTKVLAANGTPIDGITKIELFAEPDEFWRARITCFVDAPSMEGVMAELQQRGKLSWWRRALLWLAAL